MNWENTPSTYGRCFSGLGIRVKAFLMNPVDLADVMGMGYPRAMDRTEQLQSKLEQEHVSQATAENSLDDFEVPAAVKEAFDFYEAIMPTYTALTSSTQTSVRTITSSSTALG